METILALATILSTVLLGAMSPGASLLTVARISVAGQRRDGLAAAVGMGIGSTILAMLAMFGMKAVLLGIPRLYIALRLIGGVYLVYVGIKIWHGAKRPISAGHESRGKSDTVWRAFMAAFVETAWYSVVALVLSTPRPRSAYLRSKVWIDRTAGGLMGYLGVRLIVSVASN